MTDTDIREAVLLALKHIAPEIDTQALRGDAALRDQVDLDSMDFLNFILALHRELGVDVPESDYAALATIDGCVEYLRRSTASSTPRATPASP